MCVFVLKCDYFVMNVTDLQGAVRALWIPLVCVSVPPCLKLCLSRARSSRRRVIRQQQQRQEGIIVQEDEGGGGGGPRDPEANASSDDSTTTKNPMIDREG